MVCVDVGIVGVLTADGVVFDVEELALEVLCVADAVFVVAVLPDFARVDFADGEGEATFDELGAAFDGFVGVRRVWMWSGMMTKPWRR